MKKMEPKLIIERICEGLAYIIFWIHLDFLIVIGILLLHVGIILACADVTEKLIKQNKG